MSEDRKPRPVDGVTIFDGVAEQYEKLRPGYPAQLFDDVIALSGLKPGARVLEVGPGTGKATTELVARGVAVDAVEPNEGLRTELQSRMAGDPRVRIFGARFEDWQPDTGETYEALVSAQAFHWIDEATRYRQAAALLRPGGALALFWIHSDPGTGPLHVAIDNHYQKLAPGIVNRGRYHVRNRRWEDEIDRSGLFATVFMARYFSRRSLAAADYIDLLGTQADHRSLPEPRRQALFRRIQATIESAGGVIEITYRSRLYLASKRRH